MKLTEERRRELRRAAVAVTRNSDIAGLPIGVTVLGPEMIALLDAIDARDRVLELADVMADWVIENEGKLDFAEAYEDARCNLEREIG